MNNGDKKKGPGRPALPAHLGREMVTVRLPKWMIKKMDGCEETRTQVVEEGLKKANRWKEPKKG